MDSLHSRFKAGAKKAQLLRLLRAPSRARAPSPPTGFPYAAAEPWEEEAPADENEQAMSEGGDAFPEDDDREGYVCHCNFLTTHYDDGSSLTRKCS